MEHSYLKAWKAIQSALVLLLAGTVASCSTASSRSSARVELPRDTWISVADNQAKLYKAGESVDVGGEPMYLESPGYVGMILVPINGSASKIRPSSRRISEWTSEQVQADLDQKLSSLVEETNRVQVLMSKRQSKEALSSVSSLQLRYPKVAYLNFLKASALYLDGDRAQARAVLEQALLAYPNHAQARELYMSLGGDASRVPASTTPKQQQPEEKYP